MLKKIIGLVLAISILVTMFSAMSVSAAATSGSCGPSMSWRVEKSVLYITGTGEMADYTTTNRPPWHAVRSNVTQVIIETGVVSIGNYAFADCSQKLTNVVIPETVVSIGNFSFFNCKNLETVWLPAGLKTIGSSAFKECSSINSVLIPTGVYHLGSEAFSGCTRLRSAFLSATLPSIEEKTFYNCRYLEAVVLPDSVTSIGREAFAKCGYLNNVAFGNGLRTVESGAFSECGKFEIAAYNGSKETWEANVSIAANNAPLDLAHIIWNGTVYVPEGSISVIINGVRLEFDQPPVIIDGRTMVPLRAIFEALGADVVWDDAAKMVTAKREKRVVMLEIGKRHITMDGVTKELDVPAQIVNNRTLVPIRAVSEAYDCEVGWDAGTRTVVITEKMKK